MAFETFLSTTYNADNLWLYAVKGENSTKTLYRVKDESSGLSLESFATFTSSERIAHIAWEDSVFITSPSCALKKLQSKNLVDVNTSDLEETDEGYTRRTLAGKYLANFDSHLVMANIKMDGSSEPLMVVWSDLYEPEKWYEKAGYEGGYFTFPATNLAITGLSYQRGYGIIFTKNSIQSARYIGYDSGLFEFTSISNSVGCQYHYSVGQVKDVIFFAGKDNFYSLDGTTVTPVGTEVWKVFQSVLKDVNADLPVFVDEARNLIYWKFAANGQNGTVNNVLYDVVYNFVEDRWTIREADGIVAVWEGTEDYVTCVTWDELPVAFSSFPDSILWSDFVSDFNHKKLYLTDSNFLVEDTTKRSGVDDAGKNIFIESRDFCLTFDDEIITVEKIRLLAGQANLTGATAVANAAGITLQLGYRNNLHDTITWSTEVNVATELAEESNLYFHFRPQAIVGKVFRLRLRVTNKNTSYLDVLSALQIFYNISDETYNVTR